VRFTKAVIDRLRSQQPEWLDCGLEVSFVELTTAPTAAATEG